MFILLILHSENVHKIESFIEVKQLKWGIFSLWKKCFSTVIGPLLFNILQLWVFSYNAWCWFLYLFWIILLIEDPAVPIVKQQPR